MAILIIRNKKLKSREVALFKEPPAPAGGSTIKYKKSITRDLGRLDKKEARRILDKIEKDLSERAESYPALKGEFAGLRKMRIGEYGVIFTLMDNDILILRIGHRREI